MAPIKHPDTGKPTRREFPGLYVYKSPATEYDKTYNKETRTKAEMIKAQRQLSLQDDAYGFMSDKRRNTDLLEFFEKIANERTDYIGASR